MAGLDQQEGKGRDPFLKGDSAAIWMGVQHLPLVALCSQNVGAGAPKGVGGSGGLEHQAIRGLGAGNTASGGSSWLRDWGRGSSPTGHSSLELLQLPPPGQPPNNTSHCSAGVQDSKGKAGASQKMDGTRQAGPCDPALGHRPRLDLSMQAPALNPQ